MVACPSCGETMGDDYNTAKTPPTLTSLEASLNGGTSRTSRGKGLPEFYLWIETDIAHHLFLKSII